MRELKKLRQSSGKAPAQKLRNELRTNTYQGVV